VAVVGETETEIGLLPPPEVPLLLPPQP